MTFLDSLSSALTNMSPMAIGRDSNALAVEWGCHLINSRSWSLIESMFRMNVDVVNAGDNNTSSSNGVEFIIDMYFWYPGQNHSTDW